MFLYTDTQTVHLHLYFLQIYLDHGYKRHDSLHVFLQFRQGSQLSCYHFVVWKDPVVALDKHEEKKQKTSKRQKEMY